MRVIPAPLQAHLDTGATTLAWCWRITRRDGSSLGFTDHDRDIVFDATTFEAASGFDATEMRESVGLSVDNVDVEGALRSDRLSAADLEAGLYDNAGIEIWRVNWQEPDERVLVRSGSIGEVRRGPLAFVAEVRGLAHILQQGQGRTFQYACDALVGDGRCGKNLNTASFRGNGAIASVVSDRRFMASGIGGFAPDWFALGKLTWTSGANDGRVAEVKLHARAAGVVTLELWQRMSGALALGDSFLVTAGCDKQLTTCRSKFANVENFRGFPHMPGNDFITRVPKLESRDHKGKKLTS
ncbi:MAG: DUF2163 domain-containing protein [Hyphomicrobiaceae bacterium]